MINIGKVKTKLSLLIGNSIVKAAHFEIDFGDILFKCSISVGNTVEAY